MTTNPLTGEPDAGDPHVRFGGRSKAHYLAPTLSYGRFPKVEIGGSMVVEPDHFVPFVMREAVLVQEIEGVVPVAVDAKVKDTETKLLGNIGEVMFGIGLHPILNTEDAESLGLLRIDGQGIGSNECSSK